MARAKLRTLKEPLTTSSKQQIKEETFSIRGTKPINQDTIKVGKGVWIVCDGHGQLGHEVSHFVANVLYELFMEYSKSEPISAQLLSRIFIEA